MKHVIEADRKNLFSVKNKIKTIEFLRKPMP